MALPAVYYRDPFEVVARDEQGERYRAGRCLACRFCRPERPSGCAMDMSPGRHWCRGFEEVDDG
ncbi:MAG: hypothetical protein U5L11_02665 [Arhodomonas sp.]|nr:hypothetical protein [Arhodomonas sp.]